MENLYGAMSLAGRGEIQVFLTRQDPKATNCLVEYRLDDINNRKNTSANRILCEFDPLLVQPYANSTLY